MINTYENKMLLKDIVEIILEHWRIDSPQNEIGVPNNQGDTYKIGPNTVPPRFDPTWYDRKEIPSYFVDKWKIKTTSHSKDRATERKAFPAEVCIMLYELDKWLFNNLTFIEKQKPYFELLEKIEVITTKPKTIQEIQSFLNDKRSVKKNMITLSPEQSEDIFNDPNQCKDSEIAGYCIVTYNGNQWLSRLNDNAQLELFTPLSTKQIVDLSNYSLMEPYYKRSAAAIEKFKPLWKINSKDTEELISNGQAKVIQHNSSTLDKITGKPKKIDQHFYHYRAYKIELENEEDPHKIDTYLAAYIEFKIRFTVNGRSMTVFINPTNKEMRVSTVFKPGSDRMNFDRRIHLSNDLIKVSDQQYWDPVNPPIVKENHMRQSSRPFMDVVIHSDYLD